MRRVVILLSLCFAVAWCAAHAQDTLPPTLGGFVHSLGLPAIYKPYLGLGIGLSRQDGDHLAAQLRVGVFRDIGNPVTELLGWSAESYVGMRDVRFDAGARGFLLSNIFGLGLGADYSARDGNVSPLVLLALPVRRGGILGGGSDLRLEWLPGRRGSFNLAITKPRSQPHRGRTRPPRDYVELRDALPRPVATLAPDSALSAALAGVHDHAIWLNRLTIPYLGGLTLDPAAAAVQAVAPLKARLGDGTVDAEVRAYHRELALAFSIAVAGRPLPPGDVTRLGTLVADSAKAILLERVLFAYNRLLGQRKKDDTTREFGGHARGVFARWLTMASGVPAERDDACLFVFQRLLDDVEAIRATNRQMWGDSRLVWLPLQLALLPEQYAEQEQLDSLMSHAIGHSITHGNRIWYVHNDRFQQELIKSIARAEDYHVLWIHDFRGLTEQGAPDRMSLLGVSQAYLAALWDHVMQYDSSGRLPVYMIFLDQHYFEANKSRNLLNFLQDPLGKRPVLPAGFDSLDHALADLQGELRRAVAASRVLQAERAQYGEAWLHRLVKVHVNITNPADPSFRSPQILPLLGIPDDAMRDHRKAVLYDVSEADAYRGMAMFAGMGVGELYAGPAWEDRAIMLQGPVALTLRDEARALLETQGIRGGMVPHVLRPRPKTPDYERRVRAEIDSMDAWGGVASRAVEVHNETGFGLKEISVAEATLFNLMSPGGVMKVPDSVWLNQLLASLLTGGALRGARVLVIAPSAASAPSSGWPVLTLAHDLLSRLLALQHELEPELARSGGLLRVGLYHPDVSVDDLRDRVRVLRQTLQDTPFLRDLYAFTPDVYRVLDSADAILPARGEGEAPLAIPGDSARRPKLHFKGFLYLSREAWSSVISGAPMARGFEQYLRQRARQLREGPGVEEQIMAVAMQETGAQLINPVLDTMPASERACQYPKRCAGKHWVFFLQVGSPNQNYRTMTMDGEAAVLVSGWTSLYAVPDFVLLTGLTAWPDDQAALDRLLHAPDVSKLRLAWWIKMAL